MLLTLETLRERVYSRIDNNALLFPTIEVDTMINEGVKILNLFTGFQQISLQQTTESNRVWYDIPNEIVFPLRVQIENTYLMPTSVNSIGRSNPQWVTQNSNNMASQVSCWIRFGSRKLGINPADSIGGKQLTITGIREPKPLVNLDDTINFPNEIMAAFDQYASHILLLKESSKEFAMASTAYQEFLRLVKKLTIWKTFTSPRYFISELPQPLNA